MTPQPPPDEMKTEQKPITRKVWVPLDIVNGNIVLDTENVSSSYHDAYLNSRFRPIRATVIVDRAEWAKARKEAKKKGKMA